MQIAQVAGYLFGVVRGGDHHTNGAPIEALAAQPSKNTDAKEDGIKGTASVTSRVISMSNLEGMATYSVLKPAVPYWK